jgi:hypothetical protein
VLHVLEDAKKALAAQRAAQKKAADAAPAAQPKPAQATAGAPAAKREREASPAKRPR